MENLSFESISAVVGFFMLIIGFLAVFSKNSEKQVERAKVDTAIFTKIELSLDRLVETTNDSNVRIKELETEVTRSRNWRETYTPEIDDLIRFKEDQKLVNHDTKSLLTQYDKLITKNASRIEKLEKQEKQALTDFK